MQLTAYKTKKVVLGDNLENILKENLPTLSENCVVTITSKIVSITQRNVIQIASGVDKATLIRQQAEKFIKDDNKYKKNKTMLTITNNIFTPSSGIDESNGNGYFVLWPKNPMKEAGKIWNFLKKEYALKNVGVLIIDSSFIPLRTGSISIGLAWCGFTPVKSYIGTPDVFGEPLKYTKTSLVDSLSVAAGICMGEGNQQTPLVVIQDIPEIEFVNRPPSKEEISIMHYPIDEDMYGPLIKTTPWEQGENKAKEE